MFVSFFFYNSRGIRNSISSSFYHWDHDELHLLRELDQERVFTKQFARASFPLPLKLKHFDIMLQQQIKDKKSLYETKQSQNQFDLQCPSTKEVLSSNKAITQIETPPNMIGNDYFNDNKMGETAITEYVKEDITFCQENKLKKYLSEQPELRNENHSFQNEFSVLSILKQQELEKYTKIPLKIIQLSVIVIGAQGLGKSTFIDAFLHRVFHINLIQIFKKFQKDTNVIRHLTTEIVELKGTRKEHQINLHLNMIDTPGYSEISDIDAWLEDIINFVSSKYEQYELHEDDLLKDKRSVQQEDDQDCRVHVCLYFIEGPRIRKSDFRIMHKLQEYLNIIPILAKGDCYTPEELKQIKQQLIKDAHSNNIHWFDCETSLKNVPGRLKQILSGPLGPVPPFSMISSVTKIQIRKHHVQYVRKYPWGVCCVDDPNHSDFLLLYKLLIGYFLTDLKRLTEYNYRKYIREKKRQQKLLKIQEREKRQQAICTGGFLAALGLGVIFGFFQNKTN